jgi:hypothetical protein
VTERDLIRMFPIKRISPVDGLAVTAEVWEEAHRYHRQRQQLHALFSRGPGIVTGLEVVASDPPDSTVYILPGIAVDPLGQIIVLTEPTAYDVGEADGLLSLLLSYGESRPRAGDSREGEDGPLYVYAEFGVEVGRPGLPQASTVELARVRRQDENAAIVDAQDAVYPGLNEVDLRFRRKIGAAPQEVATLAVSYVGGAAVESHGRGANYLARALRRSGDYSVWVDRDVPLAPGLEHYTLVYLVGQGAFELSPGEMQVLYDYVQGGGTLFIESCRRETEAGGSPSGAPPADAAFADLLASFGFQLQDLEPNHHLLVEPLLFAAPPPGFETQGAPDVRIGDGVIFSTCDYGCLWGGARRHGPASREEIRTAIEWGNNIVAYAMHRRRGTNGHA